MQSHLRAHEEDDGGSGLGGGGASSVGERLIPLRSGTALAQRASTLAVLAALRDGFQKRCLLQE